MSQELSWKQFSKGETPSSVTLSPLFYKYVAVDSHVLDYGCAWGRVPFELQEKGYTVTGFDFNEDEIARAKELSADANEQYENQVTFDVANALDLPYQDNSFDVILMQSFMTTLVDPEHRTRVLDEAKRVLKPNGTIYMGVFGQGWGEPYSESYPERYVKHFPVTKEVGTFIVNKKGTDEELYRVHHYTAEELKHILVEPRFKIEHFSDTVFQSYNGNKAKGYIVIGKKE